MILKLRLLVQRERYFRTIINGWNFQINQSVFETSINDGRIQGFFFRRMGVIHKYRMSHLKACPPVEFIQVEKLSTRY